MQYLKDIFIEIFLRNFKEIFFPENGRTLLAEFSLKFVLFNPKFLAVESLVVQTLNTSAA